ncbi:transketolase family protein [Kribbella sp. NPDC056345]|uniref:transketolase family protein n=1 Tax=Kribbella sp. NPDC056345 TaxID=3345789 RepID=UPI0035DB2C16
MRSAFGARLLAAGHADERVFVLDADCSTSTKTSIFADEFPQRFANAGIAEQNMVGMAAGLACLGYRPVANSFAAMFVHRAHEQLMQSIGLVHSDVLLVGHYAGLSSGVEGAPHHAISDVALMRAIPGVEVWWPYDDEDAARLTTHLLSRKSIGPRYLRLERNPVVALPGPDLRTETLSAWGSPGEVAVIAAGSCVGAALAAVDPQQTRVIAVSRLSPLETGTLELWLEPSRHVVVVEEHGRTGGLWTVLVEAGVVSPRNSTHCCIPSFTETGSPAQLRASYGIDADGIRSALAQVGRDTPVH